MYRDLMTLRGVPIRTPTGHEFRTLNSCAFSPLVTERAVLKYGEVSTGKEKCAGVKEASGVRCSASEQAGWCKIRASLARQTRGQWPRSGNLLPSYR